MNKLFKNGFCSLLMALAMMASFSAAHAATTTFNGQTIEYTGATVSKAGGDLVLKFTSSGSLTLPQDYPTRILAVGGGGSGGRTGTESTAAGGGGAGEFVECANVMFSSGTYTITVGAGGTTPTSSSRGNNGKESAIVKGSVDVLRVKGGGGGGYNSTAGSAGGSGGGGGGRNTNGTVAGGDGSANEADGLVNAGSSGLRYRGGGGGGAGGPGGEQTTNYGGAGGPGVESDITGEKKYYAAGGGGGGGYKENENYSGGTGGSGIGGNGARSGENRTSNATAGTANTGSGGGGGARGANTVSPGAGGSGVVIVRLINPYVCRIGDIGYMTLQEAAAALQDGDTLTLLKDIEITSDVTLRKNVTITSEEGCTCKIVRGNENANVVVDGGAVTFTNVTLDNANVESAEAMLALESGALTMGEGATLTKDEVMYQSQTVQFANGQLISVTDEDEGGVLVKYTEVGSGTLVIPTQAKVDYLVVGGGGSGARGNRTSYNSRYTYYYGSGGNGGEVKTDSDVVLEEGQYTISVGDGGAAPTANNAAGNAGRESSLSGDGIDSITAAGGAGGTVNKNSGYTNALPGDPIPGTQSSITGREIVYGQGGAKANETAAADSVADNTGAGGQGSRYGYAPSAGGSGIVVVQIKSMKEVINGGVRAIGAGESFVLPNDAAWGDDWKVTSSNPDAATVVKNDDGTVTVTGVDEGQTTIRVENATQIFTYTTYVSQPPREVRFCEGDQAQFWYGGTTGADWFLMVGNTRYALGDAVAGEQLGVEFVRVGDNRVSMLVDALVPGLAEDGDLLVVSDGTHFYGYRMSVDASREIPLGETVDMVCASVAVKTWAAEVDDDYADFVEADCTNKAAGGESATTTATIVGLALTDEAYVRVRDDGLGDGAQGAVYTLKVAVTGVPTISVTLSSGVTMPVWYGFDEGTAETVYTVAVSNAQTCLSAALTNMAADGRSFTLDLTAAEGSEPDQTAYFTVLADGEAVATYKVTTATVNQLVVGDEVTGYLPGTKKTAWDVVSQNPEIVAATSVVYNAVYSGEYKALREGDAVFFATNAFWQAGYFGLRARVADTHLTSISMSVNTTTNIVVTHDGECAGVWTVANDKPDMLTATLPDQSGPSKAIEVTLTAGATSGPMTLTVANGYHIETVFVFIDSETSAAKPKVLVPGKLQVVQGGSLTLPATCVDSAWTATSMNPGIVSVEAASGVAGNPVVVDGHAVPAGQPSETLVMVENESAIYVYQVEVVLPEEISKETVTVNVDQTLEVDTSMLGDVTGGSSMNPLIATVAYDPATDKVEVTGVQEGTTQLKVTTADKVIYINVQVRNPYIHKHVTLFMGAEGSMTTYSTTFDGILEISSIPPAVKVERSGNTLTFFPQVLEANETNAQVRVQGFVDGLPTQSELHYWFTVKAVKEGQKIWQDPDGTGFITYTGADEIHEDPATGDLVLVFTNASDIGHFEIPDSWNAKMDILAVGGGGAGGSTSVFGQGGGGGGAGGFALVQNAILEAGSFDVVVGKGASAAQELLAGHSAQGESGYESMVTNSFGYAFARAAGGGGGGAPENAAMADGVTGGSGGGAAWFGGTVGKAGSSILGQGMKGGVPSARNTGGGGGGAGGAGGADRSAGAGKTSGLSGTDVLYAQGGVGGRNDVQTAAAAGAGPGWGGNGGNGGIGGAGGDGVVVIRISDIYRNIKVPIPGTNDVAGVQAGTYLQVGMVQPRFVWTNGTTCVAFDYEGRAFRSSTDGQLYQWSDAIASITGETQVECNESTTEVDALGNPVELGVGYYRFTIRLKDGYSWEDGGGQDTTGTLGAQTYRWVVAGSDRLADAAIDIYKTVSKFDGPNATVTVKTLSAPEVSGKSRLNILFLGSLCGKHSLTDDTVRRTMTTMVAKGNVDWYFFNNDSGQYNNIQPSHQGHFDMGATVSGLPSVIQATSHCNLRGYMSQITNLMNRASANYKPYDYIVLEFDTDRLFEYFDHDEQLETLTAQCLKPFYEQNSVIWVVDNDPSNNPWGWTTQDRVVNDDFWYTPTTYTKQRTLSLTAEWNAVVALLDPELYFQKENGQRYEKTLASGGKTYYTLRKWAAQAKYDEASKVEDMLNEIIKVKPYNVNLRDKIVDPENGLEIRTVTIRVCTNEVDSAKAQVPESYWHDLICWSNENNKVTFLDTAHASGIPGASMAVDLDSNLVTAVISNISFSVLTDIAIDVYDTGNFRTSDNATYNQQTGKWDKNPNEGNALVELVDDQGVAMNIEAEAETDTAWQFPAYRITASVVNGEAFVNAQNRLEISVGAGGASTVYYRGKPGYRLKSVLVDGEAVSIEDNAFAFAFTNITADHHIDIEYEPYFGGAEATPVTNVYDGEMHFYDVALDEQWDDTIPHEVWYSLTPDGPYYPKDEFEELFGTNTPGYDCGELTDVGEHPFYYRVFVQQQGYGEDFEEAGWAATEVEGVCTSTVTPAPLLVRPNGSDVIASTDQLPNIPYSITGFVDGEDATVLGDATDGWHVASTYGADDGAGVYDTWVANGSGVAIWAGDPDWLEPDAVDAEDGLYNLGNYYLVPSKNFLPVEKVPLEIGGVTQGPGLDPENPLVNTGVAPAERVYDGETASIDVTVTTEDSEGNALVEGVDYRIVYGIGDIANPSNPPTVFDLDANPEFVHAGTNVVWYAVEPLGDQADVFFATTNYQYVTIYPREITLTSSSRSWKYDTTEHTCNVVELTEGSLVNGDTLTTNTTASITHVGTVANEFTFSVASGDPDFTGNANNDYVVTKVVGELEVTPANIVIGEVTYPDDPTEITYGQDPETGKPNTGVEDAIKIYDGNPTNIFVDVKVPAGDQYQIRYGTNTVDGVEWLDEMPVFTDVCDVAVWFAVEPIGESTGDYTAVTNFARVVITPAEVTVKADDKYIAVGSSQPAYTATVGEVVDGNVIEYNPPTCPTYADAVGEYPIEVTGEENQGNYHVTYLPGTLHVVDKAPVVIHYVDEAGNPLLADKEFDGSIGEEIDATEFIGDIYGESDNYRYYVKEVPAPAEVTVDGLELTIVYRLPNTNIPPEVNDDPTKQPPADHTGDINDPDDPYNPGTVIDNDPPHSGGDPEERPAPWEVVPDPFAEDGDDTTTPNDPDNPGDTVARTPDYLEAGEDTRIVINTVGPGVLTWKELIVDKGAANDASIVVVIDGGDPITVHTGDMDAWAEEEIVFGGETDIEHAVEIIFTNNSTEGGANAYVDDVLWTPYGIDIAEPVTDPLAGSDDAHPELEIQNLGTDPSAEKKGDTIFNGNDLVTTSTVEDGRQTDDRVNTTAGDTTTGTEDYWYVVTDLESKDHPSYAETAPTLSAGETTTFTVTGLEGPGKLSWDMMIDEGDGADETPAKLELVVTKKLVDESGNVTNTTTATYTYTADDIADWTDGYLPFGGPAGTIYDIAFTFTNDSDGDAQGFVDNILWTIPDIDIPPTQNDDPDKPSTHGDDYPNDPGEEGNPGYKVVNDPENPWEVTPDPKAGAEGENPSGGPGENQVATTPDSVPPGGTTRITYEVENDGEFRWDSLIQPGTGTTPASVTVLVDGEVNFVYVAEDDDLTTTDDGTEWTSHVIHVEGDTEPGKPHVIELVFTNDDGDGASKVSIDDVTWLPAVPDEKITELVTKIDVPDTIAPEDPRRVVKVDNDNPSGWVPATYGDDGETLVGVRSTDGSELVKTVGGEEVKVLESTITVNVTGTGELKIGEIISESDTLGDLDAAEDGGTITIRVDGKDYPIDPGDDPKDIKDTIVTVYGGGNVEHTVEIVYTRESSDTTKNSTCEVRDIQWKSFAESDEGGSDWLKDEGVALWIVDHEERDDGRCYLAFEPQLKVKEEFLDWLRRTRDNQHIYVKYGRTWKECDECEPVRAFAREHRKETGSYYRDCGDGERDADKGRMWIQVDLPKTTVLPLGFWRVYIDEAEIDFAYGGKVKTVYVDDATGEPIPGVEPFGAFSLPRNTKVAAKPRTIPGYTCVSEPSVKTGMIETDQEIVFTYRYQKDGPRQVCYIVRYVDANGDDLFDSKVAYSEEGDDVVEYPIGIDGYAPRNGWMQFTLECPEDGSAMVVAFYYDKLQ